MDYLIIMIIVIGATTLILSKVFKNKSKFRLFLVYILIAYAVLVGLIYAVKLF